MTSNSSSSRSGGDRTLSPDEIADCEAFHDLYCALKAKQESLKARYEALGQQAKAEKVELITYHWFEKRTGISQNTWGAYFRKEKSMSDQAMAWCGEIFSIRPQDRFRTWPWLTLVPIAPDARLLFLGKALSALPEAQRLLDVRTIQTFLRASADKKKKMSQAIERLSGTPSSSRPTSRARPIG